MWLSWSSWTSCHASWLFITILRYSALHPTPLSVSSKFKCRARSEGSAGEGLSYFFHLNWKQAENHARDLKLSVIDLVLAATISTLNMKSMGRCWHQIIKTSNTWHISRCSSVYYSPDPCWWSTKGRHTSFQYLVAVTAVVPYTDEIFYCKIARQPGKKGAEGC